MTTGVHCQQPGRSFLEAGHSWEIDCPALWASYGIVFRPHIVGLHRAHLPPTLPVLSKSPPLGDWGELFV